MARLVMPLQVRLAIAFVALIGGSALAIVGYTDRAHRESTLDLAEQLLTSASQTVMARTVAFLQPAHDVTAIAASAFQRWPSVGEVDPDRLALLASLVPAWRQVESAFVADGAGNLEQVRVGYPGLPGRPLVLRRVHRTPAGIQEVFSQIRLEASGLRTRPFRSAVNDYDPRERPWYQAAVAATGPVFTDPYVFTTTQRAGVTSVQAVRGPTGGVLGVVGADISISDLSEFLYELSVGAHGHTFLIGRAGEIVAHPYPQSLPRQGDFPDVADLGIDGLEGAYARYKADHAEEQRVSNGDQQLLIHFKALPESLGAPWTVVVVADAADFLGPAEHIRDQALLISAVILAVAVALGVLVARQIALPIQDLARKVGRFKSLRFNSDFHVDSSVREVRRMAETLASTQAVLQSFSRYASATLVRKLMASGEVARLGGEERDVTVLFADLKGYSTLTERLSPAQVVEMLNVYFGVLQEVIEAHHGVVLEYIGDAVLVVFGAPDRLPGHAEHAVRCASAMRQALLALNRRWAESGYSERWRVHGIERLEARIGVHTGRVVAGNLGSRQHMKYGVVGDTVNVAARLETLNKDLGTTLLLSAEVVAALPPELAGLVRPMGAFKLKGRDAPQVVYAFE